MDAQPGPLAQEQPGVDVPGVDPLLVEADVEASGGGPGQLERRAPQRPPLAGAQEQPPLELRRPRRLRVGRAGHTAADDRRVERAPHRPHHGAVHPQRPAAHAGEELVAHRIEDHAGDRADRVGAGDADAEQRQSREVVEGAVERVDHPVQAGRSRAIDGALLGDDPVVGAAPREHLGDARLGGAVGVRDEIGRPELRAQPGRLAAPAGGQLLAGAAGGLDGDVEHVAGHRRPLLMCSHAANLSTKCALRAKFTTRQRSVTPASQGVAHGVGDDRGRHPQRAALTTTATVVAVASSVETEALQPKYIPSWPATSRRPGARS